MSDRANTTTVLVCYDGSVDAQAAIAHAARVMPGVAATILTLWEPFADALAHSGPGAMSMGVGWAGSYAEDQEADAVLRQQALSCAAEGVDRAVHAGLVAEPRIASRSGGSTRAILAVAADIDAAVVVLGTRGRGDVKSFLLGSVSHQVLQHADRAVVIVPSPELIEQRRGESVHAVAVAVA